MKDHFNLIFISALALTILCGILMGAIALYGPTLLSPQIAVFFETLKYGFTVGMLSIFGMLKGRSGTPPTSRR